MLWETWITPDAVHPRRAFQERSDVLLHCKMQLGLRIGLPDDPQGGQGLDCVPEKAEVKNHDLFRVARSFREMALRRTASHDQTACGSLMSLSEFGFTICNLEKAQDEVNLHTVQQAR